MGQENKAGANRLNALTITGGRIHVEIPAEAPYIRSLQTNGASVIMIISELLSPAALAALLEVLMIDLVLAGDNAIVIGALAGGLPPAQRKRVIAIGVVAALVFRVVFALMVSQLMGIVGLVLAGGLLLLWVAWKMYRELRHPLAPAETSKADGGKGASLSAPASFAAAAWSVALADISMSLDNVLAVAGAAREHPTILVIGLLFSIILMGVAANVIAKYIERYRWIAWIGLSVIVWVAAKMIWQGWHDIHPHIAPLIGG